MHIIYIYICHKLHLSLLVHQVSLPSFLLHSTQRKVIRMELLHFSTWYSMLFVIIVFHSLSLGYYHGCLGKITLKTQTDKKTTVSDIIPYSFYLYLSNLLSSPQKHIGKNNHKLSTDSVIYSIQDIILLYDHNT